MMMRRALLTVGLWAGITASAWACDATVSTPLQSVPIFSANGAAWLEQPLGLPAQTETIRIYDKPYGSLQGIISVTYTPGDGMAFDYTPNGGAPVTFTPTIFDADWGYGPWAHQAFIEKSVDWYRMPLPGPEGKATLGWAQIVNAFAHTIDVSAPVTYNGNTYIVVARSEDTVTVVPEYAVLKYLQVNENSCERIFGEDVVGRAARLKAAPITLPVKDLYDAQCNLLLVPTYTRGC